MDAAVNHRAGSQVNGLVAMKFDATRPMDPGTEKQQAILAEGKQIYVEMIAAMPKGADSPEVQALVERWRKHMDYFWTPDLDQLLGLAEMYNSDERFKANYDQMHPKLAEFMLEAVKVYVEGKK